ncbi:MAG: GPW/gp25 family protein [Xanthomonadales bacterium]|nr:GPW/gp25 family protein [Xanthomonadales bacterium]
MNIDYPLHFSPLGRTAETDYEEHVRDMIEQFLLTGAGERVNRPDFGSGLLQLLFSLNSPELAATLKFTAQAGLQQWLGDVVEIRELEVSSEDSTVRVELEYYVIRTQQAGTLSVTRSMGS